MSSNLTYYLTQFSNYYSKSLLRRIPIGLFLGLGLWFITLLLSELLRPLVINNDFGQTVLNDLPGIGLVIAIILVFEVWGFLPHPTENKIEGNSFEENNERV